MKRNLFIAALFTGLAALFFAGCENENAYDYVPLKTDSNGFRYTGTTLSVTITGYTGPGGEITIPSKIDGIPVDSIRNSAFTSKRLTEVTFAPNSQIRTIGDYAFSNNQIKIVDIPDSVTSIGDYAFAYNGVTDIKIGTGLTSLGYGVFYNHALHEGSIEVKKGNPIFKTYVNVRKYSDQDDYEFDKHSFLLREEGVGGRMELFLYYGGTTTILTILPQVTHIRIGAFDGVGLEEIFFQDIENSQLQVIMKGAFQNNKLENFRIPKNVKTIEEYAFAHNELETVTFEGDNVETIGVGAFSYNNLTTFDIPPKVTAIADYTFTNSGITEVIIPYNVTSIGDYAFAYNKVDKITIGTGLTTLGYGVFYDHALQEGSIKVTPGNPIFTTWKDVRKYPGEELLDDSQHSFLLREEGPGGRMELFLYYGTPEQGTLTILPQVTHIRIGAFDGVGLTNIEFQEKEDSQLKIIMKGAFQNNFLTKIEIPPRVEIIEDAAFANNDLEEVIISPSVTEIGSYAFADNELTLTSVTIGANVTLQPNSFHVDYISNAGLASTYNNNGKQAGTYTRSAGANSIAWTRTN